MDLEGNQGVRALGVTRVIRPIRIGRVCGVIRVIRVIGVIRVGSVSVSRTCLGVAFFQLCIGPTRWWNLPTTVDWWVIDLTSLPFSSTTRLRTILPRAPGVPTISSNRNRAISVELDVDLPPAAFFEVLLIEGSLVQLAHLGHLDEDERVALVASTDARAATEGCLEYCH